MTVDARILKYTIISPKMSDASMIMNKDGVYIEGREVKT